MNKKDNIFLEKAQKNHSKYLSKLRRRPTESEKEFKQFLEFINLPFIFQKGFYLPFHRIVDFYIPKHLTKRAAKKDAGIAFEIDGGYHKKDKDLRRDISFFEKRKLVVYRFTNESIHDKSFVERFYMISERQFKSKVFKKIKGKIFAYKLVYWDSPVNDYA